MVPNGVLQACSNAIGSTIAHYRPVSGGSINEAYCLEAPKDRYFLKVNNMANAAPMMAAEAEGLEQLRQSGAVSVPEVIEMGIIDGVSYLLLPYIEEEKASAYFWAAFGEALANLHRQSADTFGNEKDNFIGSLPQRNHQHQDWADFYREERLKPQVKLAVRDNLLWPEALRQFDLLYQQLAEICPKEPPALIHGDLWSGNFLTAAGQEPILIDPSVSFAHREMDLGMSLLFGGFAPSFYEAYEKAYPTQPGFRARAGIYQLYYLLVHVNLFGRSYTSSVRSIVNKWANLN